MIPTPPTRLDSLIARSCNYILGPWWTGRSYSYTAAPTLSWSASAQEYVVRGAAMAAFTLATPLYLGTRNLWDFVPSAGQTSQRDCAARLLAAVCRQHVAAPNRPSGLQAWGNTWQSPLWASWAALAAMLGWHDLFAGQPERQNVYAMLESEANYVMGLPVEYWRMANGSPGTKQLDDGSTRPRSGVGISDDSAAEENAWRAQLLWAAYALMSDHPDAVLWRNRATELNIASFAHQSDNLDGYNVDATYLVHNHGQIHPDYQTNVAMNAWPFVTNGLLGFSTPRFAFWNLLPVWDALQVASLDGLGRKAYDPNSAFVQFPGGVVGDWGWRRPHAYAVLDWFADVLRPVAGQSSMAPLPPAFWRSVHLADAGNMQFRATSATHPYGAFVDKSVAVPGKEATYPEEEVYASSQLCFLRLAQEVYYRRGLDLVTS